MSALLGIGQLQTSAALPPGERTPCTHWITSWMGPVWKHWNREKSLASAGHQTPVPWLSTFILVTVLSYPVKCYVLMAIAAISVWWDVMLCNFIYICLCIIYMFTFILVTVLSYPVKCYFLMAMATISVWWDVTSCNFIYRSQDHSSPVNMGSEGSPKTLTSIHQTA
jgi:hypothetical protein